MLPVFRKEIKLNRIFVYGFTPNAILDGENSSQGEPKIGFLTQFFWDFR